jgi:L-lactate dehydrogenase
MSNILYDFPHHFTSLMSQVNPYRMGAESPDFPKDVNMQQASRKVVVIGAGAVGTTYIYALMHTGLASEIALIDIDQKRVEGEIMDLSHGLPFVPPVHIHAGTYADCADAAIIVITAGAKQAPGQTRMQLVQKNASIVSAICDEINANESQAVILMVANPVDILTEVALKRLGRSRNTVIGSGTVLDSSRFRYLLAQHCGIDTRNVHGHILGEHGDSEIAAWSMTNIGGIPIDDYCHICHKCESAIQREEIVKAVRESAYHIIDYKGSTFYAIGLSLVRITGAILRNEHSVLTVSVHMDGEYGLHDVSLSVPCVLAANGVQRIIAAKLSPEEQDGLAASAIAIKSILDALK